MHARTKHWGHAVAAIALVILTLPLSTPLATSAAAQVPPAPPSSIPSGCTPSTTTTFSANCYLDVTPASSFNMIGTPHTFTFTCDVRTAGLYGLGGTASSPTIPAGCYNVTARVTDLTTRTRIPVAFAVCGDVAAAVIQNTVDCTNLVSPICPAGEVASPTPSPTTPCTTIAAAGLFAANTVTLGIDPGANHTYQVQFDGYIPTTSAGTCPAGTTLQPGAMLTVSFGFPPSSVLVPTAPGGACQFTVYAVERYVEITYVVLAPQPSNKTCGGPTLPFPPLRTVFGPACNLTGRSLGATILKFGVDCSTVPATGTPAPPPYPPGSTFACFNRTLFIDHILLQGTPLTYTLTGPGSFTRLNNPIAAIFARLGKCAGIPGGSTLTVPTGTVLTMCPTGTGTVAVRACLASSLPNNQPPICSNTIYARYGP